MKHDFVHTLTWRNESESMCPFHAFPSRLSSMCTIRKNYESMSSYVKESENNFIFPNSILKFNNINI